jgi:hypothetical protein
MGPRPKTNRKRGAPRKKNEAIIKRLIAAARLGLPYGIVATRAGITRETLCQWRAQDADLDRRLEEARAEAAEQAWLKIMAAGDTGLPNAWQSIAWRLERSHPESFARPEIQLNAQFNSSTTTINNLTISVEDAEKFARRSAVIEKELSEIGEAFLAKRRQANGTNGGQIREVETTLMSDAAITLPPPTGRHPNWWSRLSRGDGTRPITVEAAKWIIETIAKEALGASRASGIKVDLGDGKLVLRDVWDAISDLCGPSGWAALTRRGES